MNFPTLEPQKYIEVLGSARYDDPVYRQVVLIELAAEGAELQSSMLRLGELVRGVVDKLLGEGIRRDELTDGGTEILPNELEDENRRHVVCRLMVRCTDWQRMATGLVAVEQMKPSPEESKIIFQSLPAEYEEDVERLNTARREAMADATQHARVIAEKLGMILGQAQSVEEQWRPPQPPPLPTGRQLAREWPTRSQSVLYRVRFAVAPPREP
ncbi:MAG: hypothetical protein HJJLKODD_00431 [Phycisphaerae bacterium]|nr:hypothetical protein [Phycisphaerae bacterium]